MILGRFPGLAIDRTGVALLGAIALVATGRLTPEAAWNAIDVHTITLLLSLMVVSAQFRLGGFYSVVAQRLSTAQVSPSVLLLLLIGVSALLSAVLANDNVCWPSPPAHRGLCGRGLKPVPFLLALACASNVGSAATLIGNPQNMLIGQKLNLSFSGYLLDGVLPAALGCVAIWLLICWLVHGQWRQRPGTIDIPAPHFDLWQTAKGSVVLAGLMAAFLFAPWPREVVALAAAASADEPLPAHAPHAGAGGLALLVLFAACSSSITPWRPPACWRRAWNGCTRPASRSSNPCGSLARRWCSRTSSRTCRPSCSCCRRRRTLKPGQSWPWLARWPAISSLWAALPTSS
jgi:di/tricarboxylate transporter